VPSAPGALVAQPAFLGLPWRRFLLVVTPSQALAQGAHKHWDGRARQHLPACCISTAWVVFPSTCGCVQQRALWCATHACVPCRPWRSVRTGRHTCNHQCPGRPMAHSHIAQQRAGQLSRDWLRRAQRLSDASSAALWLSHQAKQAASPGNANTARRQPHELLRHNCSKARARTPHTLTPSGDPLVAALSRATGRRARVRHPTPSRHTPAPAGMRQRRPAPPTHVQHGTRPRASLTTTHQYL
jgi:hypothetical protein